jgi:aconitate hydratase
MVSNTRQTQQRQPLIKANYITSPPLVLAYALAGNVLTDLEHESLSSGNTNVSIRDLWPSRQEIEQIEDEIIIKKILKQFKQAIQVEKENVFLELMIYFRSEIHNGIQ